MMLQTAERSAVAKAEEPRITVDRPGRSCRHIWLCHHFDGETMTPRKIIISEYGPRVRDDAVAILVALRQAAKRNRPFSRITNMLINARVGERSAFTRTYTFPKCADCL